MAWYPDWAVALDEVSKGVSGAVVTQRNAADIIREIKKMQDRIIELEARQREVPTGVGEKP